MWSDIAFLENRLQYLVTSSASQALTVQIKNFHSCFLTCSFCPLTDVSSYSHGFPFPPRPVFIPLHLILNRSFISSAPHMPEAVHECEQSGACGRVSLCSPVRPGRQSHFTSLQRTSHAADVRLSQGTRVHMHSAEAFKCHPLPRVFYFLCCASDDRHGSAVSDKWRPVPARTRCERLLSPDRSHTPTLGADVPFTPLHHNALLQQHLKVRRTLGEMQQGYESRTRMLSELRTRVFT